MTLSFYKRRHTHKHNLTHCPIPPSSCQLLCCKRAVGSKVKCVLTFWAQSQAPGTRSMSVSPSYLDGGRGHLSARANPTHRCRDEPLGWGPQQKAGTLLPTSSPRLFLPDTRLLGKPASFNGRHQKRQRDFPSRMIFLLLIIGTQDCRCVWRFCGCICQGITLEVGRMHALRLILRPKWFKQRCRLLPGKCMQNADHRGKLKSGNLAGSCVFKATSVGAW